MMTLLGGVSPVLMMQCLAGAVVTTFGMTGATLFDAPFAAVPFVLSAIVFTMAGGAWGLYLGVDQDNPEKAARTVFWNLTPMTFVVSLMAWPPMIAGFWLAIAFTLMNQHRGQRKVSSHPHAGTTSGETESVGFMRPRVDRAMTRLITSR
jgi:hypothetical protein